MLAAMNTTGLLLWGPDLKRPLQSCYNLFDVGTRLQKSAATNTAWFLLWTRDKVVHFQQWEG